MIFSSTKPGTMSISLLSPVLLSPPCLSSDDDDDRSEANGLPTLLTSKPFWMRPDESPFQCASPDSSEASFVSLGGPPIGALAEKSLLPLDMPVKLECESPVWRPQHPEQQQPFGLDSPMRLFDTEEQTNLCTPDSEPTMTALPSSIWQTPRQTAAPFLDDTSDHKRAAKRKLPHSPVLLTPSLTIRRQDERHFGEAGGRHPTLVVQARPLAVADAHVLIEHSGVGESAEGGEWDQRGGKGLLLYEVRHMFTSVQTRCPRRNK
ncbi:unnamed protein product [Vitrella brassicaformis CCMP3155]|uniref:Uncharacterized protein n=1 Tax=Vitrella brassicaformis (strain CCMP3155) TaxID=1169540 RepID=A0A0G4EK93_VITBC|nr:unnamed protein product [Vitrella brassicaformis CCMP3155]|eukprot:CEL96841.1 unnamed protein product [Vitrella brassicaformis CCMP3155]